MEDERKSRELAFNDKIKAEEAENQKRLAAEQKRIEDQKALLEQRQHVVEDSLKHTEETTRLKMAADHERLKADMDAELKKEKERIESERTSLTARNKHLEDSLLSLAESARQTVELERKRVQDELAHGKSAMQDSLALERAALETERKQIKAERSQLDSLRQALEAQRNTSVAAKVDTAPAETQPETESGGMGEFLQAVKAQTSGSSRTFDEITQSLSGKVSRVMAMYERLQKRNAKLSGKMQVTFYVEPSGQVVDLVVSANSTNDKSLENAVLAEFATASFRKLDPSEKRVLVSYPLLFFPRQ
jgi:TonB family protein